MTNEWWIGKDLEESGHGLIKVISNHRGTEETCQDSECPSQDWNGAPPEYIMSRPTCSVNWCNVLNIEYCFKFGQLQLSCEELQYVTCLVHLSHLTRQGFSTIHNHAHSSYSLHVKYISWKTDLLNIITCLVLSLCY
jgi:hypothetical protein